MVSPGHLTADDSRSFVINLSAYSQSVACLSSTAHAWWFEKQQQCGVRRNTYISMSRDRGLLHVDCDIDDDADGDHDDDDDDWLVMMTGDDDDNDDDYDDDDSDGGGGGGGDTTFCGAPITPSSPLSSLY